MRFLRSSTVLLTWTPSVSHLILLKRIRTILTRLQLPTCPRLQLLHTLHPSVLPLFFARRTTRLRLTDHHAHRSLRQPSSPPRTAMLTKTSLLSSSQLLSQLSTRPSLHLLCVPRSSALQLSRAYKATSLRHAYHHSLRSLHRPILPLRTTMLAARPLSTSQLFLRSGTSL